VFTISPQIKVTLHDSPPIDVPNGTRVRDLPGSERSPEGLPILAALVNHDAVTRSYPLEVDSEVEFLTLRDRQGWRIYRNTVAFLLAKVVRENFPGCPFSVEHSLGNGYYCSFSPGGGLPAAPEHLETLRRAMHDLVERDVPIERCKIAFSQAVEKFSREGQPDKVDLLRFRNPPKIVTYECEGFSDLAHGVLADHAGAVNHFRILPYPPGFVLQFPDRDHPATTAPFDPQPKLFQIFREHKEWGRILGVRTVGDLNRAIADREIHELVRIAEAFHEKKIAQLADQISSRRGQCRWLLIAGPSSSGKTTFSKRLSVQLRVNGLRPVTLSVDDYFVDRSRTPLDEAGKPDFEHIETVDLELFNQHLAALDRGEEVEVPSFVFETGEREYRGKKLRIEPDQTVLIEGIHCLNPRLAEALPAEHKFKIYISALTQLNLDNHNRVATTDNRLLRRMVRDHMFRGNMAANTLGMWPSVRRGEKRWIFPYQNQADIAFNSALDYELAVLKPFAEPLLKEIKPHQEQYAEARRLMAFLEYFLSMPPSPVPPTSLLREFIGRSGFRY
jgi:uridine kinase